MKSLYERQLLPMTHVALPSCYDMIDVQVSESMRMGAMIYKPAPIAILPSIDDYISDLRQCYFKVVVLCASEKHKVRGKKRRMRRFDRIL